MSSRWVYGGAALLLVVSFLALRRATNDVAHFPVTLEGGIPALVYEPGPPRLFEPAPHEVELPVLILGHGFTADRGSLGMIARRVARAGYAVVTLDFAGHGQNRNPLSADPSRVLLKDLESALVWASTQRHYDAEKIAVAGHSMGGGAALSYASEYPGLSAVISISAGFMPTGPHPPPNTLYLFASGDPAFIRDGARDAGAQLAGLDRVVLERTYGEPARGTAVRVSEIAGANHTTILYAGETGDRIVSWLQTTLGPGDPPVDKGDGRGFWSFAALIAFFVLFSGLLTAIAPFVPRVALPTVAQPVRALGVLAGGLAAGMLLLSGVDSVAAGPFIFVPLVVGGDFMAFLTTVGVLLCVFLARRGDLSAAGLFAARTWVSAALLLGFTYIVVGTLLQTISDAWLPSHRAPLALMCALLALPFFVALEWLLRGPGRSGLWAPAVGKVLILVALGTGAASGVLPGFLVLVLGLYALFYVAFEICCWRISRTTPNPWLAALFQSGWTGWTLGSMFPVY